MRSRDDDRHTAAERERAARALAWLTGVLTTAFTVGFAVLASDGNARLRSLLMLNEIAVVTTAGMVVGTAAAWTRGWWTVKGRVAYTVTTLAALSCLTVAFVYNLIG